MEAGFEVLAIDAFADVDTQQQSQETLQVAVTGGQFDAQAILNILRKTKLDEYVGFCYGAGFEASAVTLDEVGRLIPVLGNNAETVTNSKHPRSFFALCDTLGMAYPPTAYEYPVDMEGWLVKSIGASGGGHIRLLKPGFARQDNAYYQKVQTGKPVSCLFLASGNKVQVIGYNEQWCSPEQDYPYRYGGAVSCTELSDDCKKTIRVFVEAIALQLDLRGINSMDFIVDGKNVYALELNPRLSATLDLYRGVNLFEAHVKVSLGEFKSLAGEASLARAHQIIYARQATRIANKMHWPDWVSDIPQSGSLIEVGMPICTIVAEAPSAVAAKQLIADRLLNINKKLDGFEQV